MRKIILSFILSIMLVAAIVPQISFASQDSHSRVITAFAGLETGDYFYEGNPKESELTLNLPETLTVYLKGSSRPTEISVTWKAVEDYENTDFYFYSMRPVWDSSYSLDSSLSDVLDVPWITVYRQEPKNDEIEPMITEDEADALYTQEDGAIDPDSSDADKTVEDIAGTARALKNIFIQEAHAATTAENTAAIYKYLTKTLGFNTAAACGIMTNINAESAMSPINLQNTYNSSFGLTDQQYTDRVDSGKGSYKTKSGNRKNFKTDSAGYGLCQWTSSGRKTNLLSTAIDAGKSVGNINIQLKFFANELKNSYPQVYKTLQKTPNTAAGAYVAAAEMCLQYEVPANTVNTAASRGKTCLSNYWKTYSGKAADATGTSFVSLCGYAYPKVMKKGNGITVTGYAVSNYKITSVTAKITDSNGKTIYSQTKKPGTTAYKLYNFDSAMKFSKLSAGTYKFILKAKDKLGKTVTATHTFKVKTSGSTSKAYGFKTVSGTN